MHQVDGTPIDLNLLVSLDALLTTHSVTRAARQLGVGQPAMSHALARLRTLFDDPLLVRNGRTMLLTPKSEGLKAPVARLLHDARRLLEQDADFDPRRSQREFNLACPDLLAGIVPRLFSELRSRCPRARLRVSSRSLDELARLEDGRSDVLLCPTPEEAPGIVCRVLGRVRFEVVARRGHPALSSTGELGTDAWLSHPHVVVESGSGSRSVVAAKLDQVELRREVALRVPTFLAALFAVAHSDALFNAPKELVTEFLEPLDLVVVPAPAPLPRLSVAALWHERFDTDPGQRLFRELVIARALETVEASA
ncbi:MAG: LysR family transcriptional regulator [Myxococcales bacterium]|nr:LysR family transcriptional regulator [Myxococcales bacterium]